MGGPLVPSLGVALIVSLVLTPVVRSVATVAGLVARPSGERWHDRPTALAGGVALAVGVFAGLIVGDVLSVGPAVAVALSAALMFLTGLADDVISLTPSAKLAFQGIGGALLVTLGVVYRVTGVAVLDSVLTLVWFIALSNAWNLLDNMDGAAAGVAVVASLGFSVLFVLEGAFAEAALAAAVAGAALGFLPWNARPASIFMGDCGSLFLGGALAGLGAAYTEAASSGGATAALAPLLVCTVPLFDTTLVTVTRTLGRTSILQGGRDHSTHRLVAMGLSEGRAVLALCGLGALGGAIAVTMRGFDSDLGVCLAGLYAIGLLVLGAYLDRFHVYEGGDSRRIARAAELLAEVVYRRRAFEVILDIAVFATAYAGAYLLRWDAALPPGQATLLGDSIALAVATKLALFGVVGVYRGVWQGFSVADLQRLWVATVGGSLATVGVVVVVFHDMIVSPSVFVLDLLLVGTLATGARASFRLLDQARRGLGGRGEPVLVYGAGRGGELVARALLNDASFGFEPVAYLDEDPRRHGRMLHGCPVMGGAGDVVEVATRTGATALVVSPGDLDDEVLERLRRSCDEAGLRLLRLTIELRAHGTAEETMAPAAGRG